ncbi:unnamed protein product, partial [Medioppia subpectinata]
ISDNKRKPVDRNESDIAVIKLTGGTNDGRRRLVAKTHSNLIHAIQQMQDKEILCNNSEDVIILLPFDKLFAIEFLMSSLVGGSKTVIINGTFDTNIGSYLDSIQSYKVSKLICFSSDVNLLIKNEVNLLYNMSSIKEILYIGVFDDYNNVRQSVENMFKCRYFRGVYGTTESGVIACLRKTKSFQYNSYSSGQLISGTQLKIVDMKSGDTLPAHRIGEICVKSKQLGHEYLSDTNNASKANNMTNDGYFKTSDAGYYDSDGNVYIESNASDIIYIEDQMFKPNELQLLLLSHPDVIDTTVIGIHCEDIDPDYDTVAADEDQECPSNDQLNNTFKIFVVLKVGSETTDLDLINYINDRVEPIRQIDSGIF